MESEAAREELGGIWRLDELEVLKSKLQNLKLDEPTGFPHKSALKQNSPAQRLSTTGGFCRNE